MLFFRTGFCRGHAGLCVPRELTFDHAAPKIDVLYNPVHFDQMVVHVQACVFGIMFFDRFQYLSVILCARYLFMSQNGG